MMILKWWSRLNLYPTQCRGDMLVILQIQLPWRGDRLLGRLESVRHIRRYLRMSIVGVENICEEKSEYLANKHLWIQENANCEKKNRNICRYLLPPTFQIPNIPSPMLHAIQHKTRKGKVFEKKNRFLAGGIWSCFLAFGNTKLII